MISSGTVVFCLVGLAAAGCSFFDRHEKQRVQEQQKQVRTVFGNKVQKRFPYAFEPLFHVMNGPVAKYPIENKVLSPDRSYESRVRKPYRYVKRNKPYVERDEVSDTVSEYPLRVQAENESPYKVFKDLNVVVNVPVEKKYTGNAFDGYESDHPFFESYKVPVEIPVDKLPFEVVEKRVPYPVEKKETYHLINDKLSAMNIPYKIPSYGGMHHKHTSLQSQIFQMQHQEKKRLMQQELGLGVYYSGPQELNFYQQYLENRDGPNFVIKPQLRNTQESRYKKEIEEQNPHDYYLKSGVKRQPMGERSYSMYSVFEDNQESVEDNKEPIGTVLLSSSEGDNPIKYEHSVYNVKPPLTEGPGDRTNSESKTAEVPNFGQHYVLQMSTADDLESDSYMNRYESFKGCGDRFCSTSITNIPLERSTHLHSPIGDTINGKLSVEGSDGIEKSEFGNNNVILTSNNSAEREAIGNSAGFDVKTNIMVST